MRWVVGALSLVLLAGCGVRPDEAPRPLAADRVPFALASDAPPDQAGRNRAGLFFVREGRVALVARTVEEVATPRELLELLFAGPTPTEIDAGVTTALGGVRLTSVELPARNGRRRPEGVAVVDLSGDVGNLKREAVAQIVATLTPNQAAAVRLTKDGEPLSPARGDGTVGTQPLDRYDFAEVLDPAALASPPVAAPPAAASPPTPSARPPVAAPAPPGEVS